MSCQQIRLTSRLAPGALAAILLVLCASGSAQQPQPQAQTPPPVPGPAVQTPPGQPAPATDQQPQQPTFRTDVSFVRVDVIVTDKAGQPLMDLKQTDFELFEDNKPQKIEAFKLVKVLGLPGSDPDAPVEAPRAIRTQFDEETEASRDDVRIVAIFLDDYHVRRGASMVAREPLMRFIQNQLAPTDLVAVMYPLTPVADVQLTRNHQSVARALQTFDGRKYDYTPRNTFEERYANYPVETVERIRNEVSMTAIRALSTRLGGMREGRKAMILVSEGYTNYVPPQLRDPVASMPGYANPNRRDPMAGERNQNEDRTRFFSQAELLSDLREVYAAANRNNVAIYALDPRGLAPFEFDINEGVGGVNMDKAQLDTTMDTLRTLASETDGRAIVNRNDLEVGLKQLVTDSSAYYLLGYTTTQSVDGKFHELKVRIKRPGAQVRARKGYWALKPAEAAATATATAAAAPPEVTEALAGIAQPRGRVTRSWIGMSRGEGGKTRITFIWEPTALVPGQRRDEPARVSLTAAGATGSAYFRGRVPAQSVASAAAPAATAGSDSPGTLGGSPAARGPSRAVFDAPPGPMEIRMSIEGTNGQVLDTETRDITVPDFNSPSMPFSTPSVLRARSARDFQALLTDPDSLPTANREFRRTDRLLIRFDVYAPAGAAAAPVAKLLSRAGQTMSTLNVPPSGERRHQIDLPLASLANGDYLVEISASGDTGAAKALVAFKVIS